MGSGEKSLGTFTEGKIEQICTIQSVLFKRKNQQSSRKTIYYVSILLKLPQKFLGQVWIKGSIRET